MPIWCPALNTCSVGCSGHVKWVWVATGTGAATSSESRFEESRMPRVTRHGEVASGSVWIRLTTSR
jgi:hypothetical protein